MHELGFEVSSLAGRIQQSSLDSSEENIVELAEFELVFYNEMQSCFTCQAVKELLVIKQIPECEEFNHRNSVV